MAAYAKRHGGPLRDPDIDALVAFIRGWQSESDATIDAAAIKGNAAVARFAFEAHCAECHGMRGQGMTAVSLSNPEFLAAASDGQIRWAIVNGRRGTPMPPFAGKFTSQSWQHETPQ
jgi:mono/diheme cytochrome c family protein